MGVGLLRPFTPNWRNVVYIVIGMGQVAHVLLYLGIFSTSNETYGAASFLWSLLALTLVVALVTLKLRLQLFLTDDSQLVLFSLSSRIVCIIAKLAQSSPCFVTIPL